MQEFLSRSRDVYELLERMKKLVFRDMKREYPDVDYFDENDLIEAMQDVYEETRRPFVVIIDEWDCIFREYKEDKEAQAIYLDFPDRWQSMLDLRKKKLLHCAKNIRWTEKK